MTCREIIEAYRDSDRDTCIMMLITHPTVRKAVFYLFKIMKKNILDHFKIPLTLQLREELHTVAVIGVINAMDTFDPGRNLAFMTHAKWIISNQIRDYCKREMRQVQAKWNTKKHKTGSEAPPTETDTYIANITVNKTIKALAETLFYMARLSRKIIFLTIKNDSTREQIARELRITRAQVDNIINNKIIPQLRQQSIHALRFPPLLTDPALNSVQRDFLDTSYVLSTRTGLYLFINNEETAVDTLLEIMKLLLIPIINNMKKLKTLFNDRLFRDTFDTKWKELTLQGKEASS